MIYNTPIINLGSYNKNNIFVKREDLLPFSFGGNKARKAALFFDDILKRKCDVVITYGSHSSNLVRVVGNYCKKYNLECIVVMPESRKNSYNTSLAKLLNVSFITCGVNDVAGTIENLILEKRGEGKSPYFIPGGGHGNIGTQAYVDVFGEIQHYERQNDLIFDYIFLASGTGTTQAGLVCGKIINNAINTIVGISIARKNPNGKTVVCNSVKDYLEENSLGFSKTEDIVFADSYIAGGYGKYNQEIIAVINETLCNYGLHLDTTYTGKAFWGMKEYIVKESIEGKNILFIHTGGAPLYFDYLREIEG